MDNNLYPYSPSYKKANNDFLQLWPNLAKVDEQSNEYNGLIDNPIQVSQTINVTFHVTNPITSLSPYSWESNEQITFFNAKDLVSVTWVRPTKCYMTNFLLSSNLKTWVIYCLHDTSRDSSTHIEKYQLPSSSRIALTVSSKQEFANSFWMSREVIIWLLATFFKITFLTLFFSTWNLKKVLKSNFFSKIHFHHDLGVVMQKTKAIPHNRGIQASVILILALLWLFIQSNLYRLLLHHQAFTSFHALIVDTIWPTYMYLKSLCLIPTPKSFRSECISSKMTRTFILILEQITTQAKTSFFNAIF